MRVAIFDLATLRHLASRTHARAAEIGIACHMAPAEVRSRLVMLESMRLVSGRQNASSPPPRAYILTDEGQRKVEIGRANPKML